MALDPSAGQRRSVSITRNLMPQVPQVSAASAAEAPVAPLQVDAKPVATQSGRNKKISFLTDSDLELRFRKARLKGGFEKLEDAYNEALKQFCDKIERS